MQNKRVKREVHITLQDKIVKRTETASFMRIGICRDTDTAEIEK